MVPNKLHHSNPFKCIKLSYKFCDFRYTKVGRISRARSHFYHGRSHFMVYTERLHFYRRYIYLSNVTVVMVFTKFVVKYGEFWYVVLFYPSDQISFVWQLSLWKQLGPLINYCSILIFHSCTVFIATKYWSFIHALCSFPQNIELSSMYCVHCHLLCHRSYLIAKLNILLVQPDCHSIYVFKL